METATVPKFIEKCCQWSSQINRDHRDVVEELRRVHFVDEDREEQERRFKMIDDETLVLLDELRTCIALALDAKNCSIITSFIDKIVWSWQDAECWIRHETSVLKTQCRHVYSSYCLHVYAQETMKSIRGTYRVVFEMTKGATTWHPDCIENFCTKRNMIIPKLSRLLQCDVILQNLTFFKRATSYREHQRNEIQEFIATHLQTPDYTVSDLLPTSIISNPFHPLCALLTGELLGIDPLIIIPSPKPQQPTALVYKEPLTYQEFKNLPGPVSHVSHLPRDRPETQSFDGQSYGEVVSYVRTWGMRAKGLKLPMKKRGPYKKRDKPLVVTCELVKVRDAAEALQPIKMPKLRENLLMPLN